MMHVLKDSFSCALVHVSYQPQFRYTFVYGTFLWSKFDKPHECDTRWWNVFIVLWYHINASGYLKLCIISMRIYEDIFVAFILTLLCSHHVIANTWKTINKPFVLGCIMACDSQGMQYTIIEKIFWL